MDFQDDTLRGNEKITSVIHLYHQTQSEELYTAVCLAIRARITQNGHFIFPADITTDANGTTNFCFKTTDVGGVTLLAAFTDPEEFRKAPPSGAVSQPIDAMLENLLQQDDIAGLILNPCGEQFPLGKEDIAMILMPGSERFL